VLLSFPSDHAFGAIYVVGVAVLLALFSSGCGDDEQGSTPGTRLDDPGPVHVHGLGVNPKDGALFIATHTGLFRAVEGEQRSTRVGDRYQDTMGFTVAGPDRFLGSGHPDFQKDPDLPPLLGLIESDDAGESWEPVSMLGEADFHVLEARGSRVYGFDSSGERLMVSSDGGERWIERSPPEPLLSLAMDSRQPERIVVAGETGLYLSSAEGRRWRRVNGDPGLLAWPAPNRLYLVGGDGSVAVSRGPRKGWRGVGEIGGRPAAFEAEGPRDLYAALHDGTVKRSTDGGQSWEVRSRP
jgi:photosystem II stability/assembly factor-like uncharacterized protein